MLPRAIGLVEAPMPVVGPTSVTATPLQSTSGIATIRKYSGSSGSCGRHRRLRPDTLTAEGSIPPPRCRHHVTQNRATVPRAAATVCATAEETSGVAVHFSDRRPPLSVSVLEWLAIAAVTIAVFSYDFVVVARRPREPTMRECAITLAVYVGLAGIFAIRVWLFHGDRYAIEFLAGWVTE